MTESPNNETYSDAETEKRAAAMLKRMLQTPHKPHKKGAGIKPAPDKRKAG
jgi:hypothetical protein